VEGNKQRRAKTTITKRKKIRRMSKDLNAKNNLADTLRGFQKDWPLSNNDAKLTKKKDNQKALDNFFAKVDEDVAKLNKFLNRVWSNKAKMPSLYPPRKKFHHGSMNIQCF
jgi:hypothetical protein